MKINERFIRTVKQGINPQLYKEYHDGGADINFQNDLALRISVKRKRFANTMALLAVGANPNAMKGLPLKYAVENDDIDVAILLLEKGARIEGVEGKSTKMRMLLKVYNKMQNN